ncbi:MAG: DNA alkylation repair protein [Candidatus Wallbacteria bacterium]|nr:DNA alkylation repair protein [Candidatus Wallbacteria bacterium]
MKNIIDEITALLKSQADPKVAANYEQYFKKVIRFHGLKTPEIRNLFSEYYSKSIKTMPFDEQIELAYRLFESKYAEEKSFGIGILKKNLKKLDHSHIKDFEPIIDKHIYDWGTSDSLSGKIISRMIEAHPEYGKLLIPWKDAKCLWRQRSACVSFVNVARFGKHNDTIIKIGSACVKNPERFVQLGLGWMLRELSLADLDLTIKFIKANYRHFSREGLRYAIEKMEPDLRQEMLAFKLR